jgi:hypothetical protein
MQNLAELGVNPYSWKFGNDFAGELMKKSRRDFMVATALTATGLAAGSSAQDTGSQGPGTVIRGVDGNIYWIPDNKLSAFRLPDDKAAKIKSLIDESKLDPLVANLDNKFSKSIGIARGEEETETLLNLGAVRQKKR